MPHHLIVNDRVLYAWCARDTLFLPELLGQPAPGRVPMPNDAPPVSLTVKSTEISDVHPADTVLSFLHRDEPFDADSITTFCHYVHFFRIAHRGSHMDRAARPHIHHLTARRDGDRASHQPRQIPQPAHTVATQDADTSFRATTRTSRD